MPLQERRAIAKDTSQLLVRGAERERPPLAALALADGLPPGHPVHGPAWPLPACPSNDLPGSGAGE